MGIDIRKEQEKTILGQVNVILDAGEFHDPEKALQEEEAVIGEMTAYEKALLTAFYQAANKHNELVDKVKAGEVEEDELKLAHATADTLKEFFWGNIRYRLGKSALEPDALGVRNGWQIVAMNGNGHEHGGARIIRVGGGGGGLFEALMGGGMPEGMEHDCENCPDYDRCQDPDKKPRG